MPNNSARIQALLHRLPPDVTGREYQRLSLSCAAMAGATASDQIAIAKVLGISIDTLHVGAMVVFVDDVRAGEWRVDGEDGGLIRLSRGNTHTTAKASSLRLAGMG